MKRILLFLLAPLIGFFCQTTHAEPKSFGLTLTLPGNEIALESNTSAPPPTSLSENWYSVSLERGELVVDTVTKTRDPDSVVVTRKLSGSSTNLAVPQEMDNNPRHALALPVGAILGFRFSDSGYPDSKPPTIRIGRHASLLATPVLLRANWRQDVNLDSGRWSVGTEHERRKDGQVLAGSMSIVAFSPQSERHMLVPPARVMTFARQELLWLGQMTSTKTLDLILRRTWVTGEVDYVLIVGNSKGFAYLDQDRPFKSFSSGIGEYETFERHSSQSRQPPGKLNTKSSFSISEGFWNSALGKLDENDLPGTIADRLLKLNSEPVRFTFEYVPYLRTRANEASSTNPDYVWEGPLHVKIHFRQTSQVLLQASSLDGGGFGVTVGYMNGEIAIGISMSPHYNNSFTYYWVWSEIDGRFLRLLKVQLQGC